ncbi:MAG: LytS/YhcK type 5TM receptor domain-containing protein [Bacillota bacterium]|nr:LytS/YhcK type 5TM receptor domain-containing protein [Bacillota bacterium]
MANLLWGLLTKVSIIIVVAYLFSNTKAFNKTINNEHYLIKDKILLSIFFGGISILGTYSGIPYMGAIVNNRVIGVVIGGLIGGPLVGFLSGLIAGGHRFLIDIGGFTALSCGISTILEGLIAGYFSSYYYNADNKVSFAFLTGLITESVQMLVIVAIARPIEDAIILVEKIAIPMILVNSIGISIIIAIIQNIRKQNDAQAAFRAQMALKIANKTLPYLSKGLTIEAAKETVRIIYDIASVNAVSLTDNEKILAHIGDGSDHHLSGDLLHTQITKEVLATGEYKIAYSKETISCDNPECVLKSAIVAPLIIENQTVGSLKLYNSKNYGIKKVDLELVLGLASLFSTQIELSKIENQSKLLAKAELRALQAQINPHFLFNALNTINSLIRIDPNDARKQLVNLAEYFRHNLNLIEDKVPLEKELNQIKSYLEIEKARYRDNLEIEYEIDVDLSYEIPPIIVQPIIENSIKHGIFKMNDKGKIKISFKEDDYYLYIEVLDNGIGMKDETIEKILSDTYSSDSIGIINIHKRLINMYGEENGLEIFSIPSEGTTVKISIPIEEV